MRSFQLKIRKGCLLTDAPTSNAGSQDEGKAKAVTSLILGITAFFPGCCLAVLYVNYVLAALAIIFGAMSIKGPGRGMATAGLVLGIVAIVLPLVLTVVGLGFEEEIEKWLEQQQQSMSEASGDAGATDANSPDAAGADTGTTTDDAGTDDADGG